MPRLNASHLFVASVLLVLAPSTRLMWAAEPPLPAKHRIQSRRAADPFGQLLPLPRTGQERSPGRVAAGPSRGGDQSGDSGATPIVPGKPEESELVRRISVGRRRRCDAAARFAQDADAAAEGNSQALDRTGGRVSAALVVRTARQSATCPPGRTASTCWCRSGSQEVGLKPSPEADRRTLIRRLYFDLLGLAADAGGGRGVCERSARRTPTRRLVDRVLAEPALRRADGDRAGSTWCGSPTRSATTATPRRTSGRIAIGSSSIQRKQAVRPLHDRASRRRPAARRNRRKRASARRSIGCCSRRPRVARSRKTTRPA